MKPVTDPSLLQELDTGSTFGSPVTDPDLLAELDTPETYSRGPTGRGARVAAVPANLTNRAQTALRRGAPLSLVDAMMVDELRKRSYSVGGQKPTDNIDDQGIADPFASIPGKAGARARGGRGRAAPEQGFGVHPSFYGKGTLGMPYKVQPSTSYLTDEQRLQFAPEGSWVQLSDGTVQQHKVSAGDFIFNHMLGGTEQMIGGLVRPLGEVADAGRGLMVPHTTGDEAPAEAALADILAQIVPTTGVTEAGTRLAAEGTRDSSRASAGVTRPNSFGAAMDDKENALRYHGGTVLESLPLIAASILAAPEAGSSIAALGSGGQTFGQDRAENADPLTAGKDALLNAALEKITEILPLEMIHAPAGGNPLLKALGITGAEMGSEAIAGGSQAIGQDVAFNRPVDLADALRQTVDSAIAGAGMAGPMATAGLAHDIASADNVSPEMEPRMAENSRKASALLAELLKNPPPTGPGQVNPLTSAIRQGLNPSAAPQVPTSAPAAQDSTGAPEAPQAPTAAQEAPDLTPRQPVLPQLEPGVTAESLLAEHAAAQTEGERSTAAARIAAYQEQRRVEAEAEKGTRQEAGQEGQSRGEGGQDRGVPGEAPAQQQGPVTGDRMALDSPIGQAAQQTLARVKDAPRLVLHQTIDTIPADIRERAKRSGGIDEGVQGFYDEPNDTIHIIAGHINDLAEAEWTVDHEIGHAVLRSSLRRRGSSIVRALHEASSNPTIRDIVASMKGGELPRPEEGTNITEEAVVELLTAYHRGGWDEFERTYGVRVPEQVRKGATSVLSRLWENIKQFLAKAVGRDPGYFTDTDLVNMLQRAQNERSATTRANSKKENGNGLPAATSGRDAADARRTASARDTNDAAAPASDNAPAATGPGTTDAVAAGPGAGTAAADAEGTGGAAPTSGSAAEKVKNPFTAGVRYDKEGNRVSADEFKRRADESFEEWEKRILALQKDTIVFSRSRIPNFDKDKGWGATSYGMDINHFGYEVQMRPSKFLALASPRPHEPSQETKDAIANGQPISPPFLRVDFSGDTPTVNGHEGRGRMMAIREAFGDIPVPVHIIGANGLRSKQITPKMRDSFRVAANSEESQARPSEMVLTTHEVADLPDDDASLRERTIAFQRARTRNSLLRDLTPDEQKKVTEKVAAKIIAQLKDLPSTDEMAAAALAGQAKRGWYQESAKTIAAVFGGDAPRFAMLLAALSPQVSVETNLSNALNTWKNWVAAGRPTDHDEIVKIMGQSVEGSRGANSVLPAWINNSVRALGNATLEDVVISGPKVNSFYQNLIGNVQEVTNDAWMANFAAVNQTIFKGGLNAAGTEPGKGTGYLAMNSQIRRTARQLTEFSGEKWTPAEVQETIWSWAKTAYEMADSAGEKRSVEQLIVDQAVTDELIASTPDFGTLFTDPKYAAILKESGYGDQLEELAGRDAARKAGEESGARAKAGTPSETMERALRKSARRIDVLRHARRAADAQLAEVPFSRKAKNVYGPVQGRDLKGAPGAVNIPGRGLMAFHGFEPAQSIAAKFAARHGGVLPREYAHVDPEQAEAIADAYQAMKHDPTNPWVARAYKAMIEETAEQYRAMLDTGLTVEFIPEDGPDPYAATPRLAILDVVENNHLWVFPTRSGFGDESERDFPGNPLLEPTLFEISGQTALANDIFRAVHDYFGHIANGNGFRADGEENAWLEHSAMYSPLARQAMTSETRGQNNWVNYGPYGEQNRTASGAQTEYAQQKTGLLPRWVIDNVKQAPQITRTPAFKKWFGDSKVVDENGSPLQVFHGTISPEGFQFTEFSPRTGRNGSPRTVNAIGSWFSDNPEHANIFSGSSTQSMPRTLQDQRVTEGATVIPVYLSIQNPLEVRDGDHMQQLWEDWGQGKGRWSKGEPEFFRDRLKSAGYDGLHFLEADKVDNFTERGEYWVALESPQIKSAIGNTNFDPWEDNIVFSRKFNAKPQKKDAVAVNAIHYSNTPDLKAIDPKKAGSGAAGGERRRFGTGVFGKQGGTSARVAFYVHEDDAARPPPEDVVRAAGGEHPYAVRLTNLYDLDADAHDFASRNMDATEEAISDAGYDGFVTGGQSGIDGRVAVVYDIGNKKIPVEPLENEVAFQRVFHGTPHEVDKFSLQKIGTGEGAQAFGWGLYFAGRKELADWYRDSLSGRHGIDHTLELHYNGKKVDLASDSPEWTAGAWAVTEGIDGAIAKIREIMENDRLDGTYDYADYYNAALKYLQSLPYESKFTMEKRRGNTYAVDIPDNDELLAFDDVVGNMPKRVRESIYDAFKDVAVSELEEWGEQLNTDVTEPYGIDHLTGKEVYQLMEKAGENDAFVAPHPDLTERGVSGAEQASHHLYTHGLPGLYFKDRQSRSLRSVAKIQEDIDVVTADLERAKAGKFDPRFSPEYKERAVATQERQLKELHEEMEKAKAGTHYNYVVWDESQISAPEIVFARQRPGVAGISSAHARRQHALNQVAAQGVQMGTPSTPPPGGAFRSITDSIRTVVQDKMLPLLRTQNNVGNVADTMDAYTLENMMYGAVHDDLLNLDRDYVLKLQRMLKNTGLKLTQLEDYLLARHAPERNAAIATINPAMPDAGAGITTALAQAILAGQSPGPYSGKPLSPTDLQHAQTAAAVVDGMRAHLLDVLESSGQITPALAAQLRAKYKHYIPLRGKDSEEPWMAKRPGTGKGLSVGRGMIKRALGRGDANLAKNLVAELVGDSQRAIVQAGKAKVMQAFLRFAIANPMPDLFTVSPVDLEWKFSKTTGEAYLGVKSETEDQTRSVVVPNQGSWVRIRFEDEALRDAIMNMGVDDLGALVKYLGFVNRWRSGVLTRFNPAFAPINMLRDLQFGMTAILSEKGAKLAAKAAINYGPALKALFTDAGSARKGDSSVPDAQKSYHDWVREYTELGGKTGMTQIDDVVDLQKRLSVASSTIMQLAAEGKPITAVRESLYRAGEPILHAIERVNDATENALRVAIYIADVQAGTSKQQAVEYAKNVTINFNRKGKLGPLLNAIYLFFNASMQGTHAVLRVMKDPRVSMFLVALGGLQAFMAAGMQGDDDDDGVTDWDMVPDYVKRTSLVIPLGWTGSKHNYFALPMPYGFNMFTYTGGRLTQYVAQGARPTDHSVIMDLVKSMTEAFSPVPVFEGYNALFGDTLGALMQLASNKDDLGQPIAQDNGFAPYDIPKAIQGRPDTPRAYHSAAQMLAKMGGADLDNRIPPVGFLDIAPEQLEFITNFMGGGLANIANKSTRWWEQFDANNFESPMDYVSAAPIASRLVGSGSEARAVAERYYGEAGEFARKVDVMKSRIRQGEDPEKVLKDTAAREPSLRGVELARYKRAQKETKNSRGGQPGDVRLSKDGMPKFQPGQGTTFAELKESAKSVEDLNGAIRDVREPDATNAQVVKMMNSFGVYELGDLGLEPGYTATAVSPNRVRQRAIKLLQGLRMNSEKSFLKATERAKEF